LTHCGALSQPTAHADNRHNRCPPFSPQDVSMADEERRTPLHWAAGMGHPEVAALLIKEGAALEAADSKGNTPLMYAAGYGRPNLVRMLLSAGAKGGAKNSNGKTAADLT
jgi:ankyrin repeat protein